ncbi:response regulator [Mucilaginibacter myungsuensis]|uniref:Response regulator n=1 Tax=Mucilaginibacter myungsuensis TaxID=649104 RepID=A0A929PX61_9SPHI|nr:response regulator [Mucilaginibacter myungsuensis]MBE9662060.1 response regulator [Mucilaginibacter myungsuensis]MDN3599507.1 response regulator [Mucilaginibacter myungsuensis]
MKKVILIVDDDLGILKLLNFILSKEYEIVVKTNGFDALDWLELGNLPDLIISDLAMPTFDGQAFVKNVKISGFYGDIPVVLLSAAHDLDEQVGKMPFRVEAFLQKPFNPNILKTEISKILQLS